MSSELLDRVKNLISMLDAKEGVYKLVAYITLLYLYHSNLNYNNRINFIRLLSNNSDAAKLNEKINKELENIRQYYNSLSNNNKITAKQNINMEIEKAIKNKSDSLKDIHYKYISIKSDIKYLQNLVTLIKYVDPVFGTVFEAYDKDTPYIFFDINNFDNLIDFSKSSIPSYKYSNFNDLVSCLENKGIAMQIEEDKILIFPVVTKFSQVTVAVTSLQQINFQNVYGYTIVGKIGEGATSIVYKAEKGGKYYAIKIFKPTTTGGTTRLATNYFSNVATEASNLITLSGKSPYIVRIEGIHMDVNSIKDLINGRIDLNNPPAIIMEFMEGGSVWELMQNTNITYSTCWPEIVKKIVKQVALALDYLHSQGYVHLDVKPQNIFLSKDPGKTGADVMNNVDGIVKLGDLGSAVKIGGKIDQVTPAYAPPEQVEASILGSGADPKMDIFALGMSTYVLLTLRSDNPASNFLDKAIESYNNGNIRDALDLVNQAKQALLSWKPTLPQNTPSELQQVILNAIKTDPQSRPTAKDIIKML